MKKIFVLSLALLCFAYSGAQSSDFQKLNLYFDALENGGRFMGKVAVSKHGEIVFSRTLGYSNLEQNIKAGDKSCYRVGSVSKTYTAAMVMKAVEQGLLSLDCTLDKFFPDIINSDKITIEQMLTHRSGIHNFTNNPDYFSWHTTPKSEAEMVGIIKKSGVDFDPGAKTSYSNSNYVLLSYILQKVYNKSYAKILKKIIIDPLALKSTYYGSDKNSREVISYNWKGEWIAEPSTDITVPIGAGAIVSEPIEMLRFVNALFGGEIVSKESLGKMMTFHSNYGMALVNMPFYNKRGVGHTGGIDAFWNIYIVFPEDSVSIAVSSNGTGLNNNDVVISILSAVYGKPFEIPVFKSISVSPDDLDKYCGEYTSDKLPFSVKVYKSGKNLFALASGQRETLLEATDIDEFACYSVGATFGFNVSDKTMTLKQRGASFVFNKK